MSEKLKALAEQFLMAYKGTPEFGNWDAVIELGKTLAESVLAENGLPSLLPKIAQPAPKSIGYGHTILTPNDNEKSLLDKGLFSQAVTAMCLRTSCSNQTGRASCKAHLESNGVSNKDATALLNERECNLIKRGSTIEAIKSLRHRTNWTLFDAKRICEAARISMIAMDE